MQLNCGFLFLHLGHQWVKQIRLLLNANSVVCPVEIFPPSSLKTSNGAQAIYLPLGKWKLQVIRWLYTNKGHIYTMGGASIARFLGLAGVIIPFQFFGGFFMLGWANSGPRVIETQWSAQDCLFFGVNAHAHVHPTKGAFFPQPHMYMWGKLELCWVVSHRDLETNNLGIKLSQQESLLHINFIKRISSIQLIIEIQNHIYTRLYCIRK